MQYQERRGEERIALDRQPKGELHLLVGTESIRISVVKDISPLGFQVETNAPVWTDEPVHVTFHHESVDLRLNGTVAWSSAGNGPAPSGPGETSYMAGINLISPMLLYAFL